MAVGIPLPSLPRCNWTDSWSPPRSALPAICKSSSSKLLEGLPGDQRFVSIPRMSMPDFIPIMAQLNLRTWGTEYNAVVQVKIRYTKKNSRIYKMQLLFFLYFVYRGCVALATANLEYKQEGAVLLSDFQVTIQGFQNIHCPAPS